MRRRFSIPLAVLLAGCLLLGGCSDPGPLPEGRWFLPYYSDEGPHLWIGRTIVNTGLALAYGAFGAGYAAAYFLASSSSLWVSDSPCH